MELLQSLGITFKPSSAKPNYRCLFHFSYLCTPFVEMNDLTKDFQSCKNDQQFQSLCQKFEMIGKSLAELHMSKPLQSVDDVFLMNHLERMRAKVRSIKKLQHDQWQQYCLLEQEFIRNPGVHTLTHGDPNLGNFIVQENKVILLDLDRLYHCFQMVNRGFPADDFYRFIASIQWFRSANEFLNDNHCEKLTQSFSQSYHQTIEPMFSFTKESIQFYSFYLKPRIDPEWVMVD
jgi:hypothetical protein